MTNEPDRVRDVDFFATVARRVHEVRERVLAAGGRGVRLIAVTKTFGVDAVLAATAAGCEGIGENYAQELVAKFDDMSAVPEVHFIGQLQTNKVRMVAPFVAVYETVDRSSLALEIAKRAPGARILVQVDATDEPGKGGCSLGAVAELVGRCLDLGLHVEGLMTVGYTVGGPEASRGVFRMVRSLADELNLAECSMGMSGDFEVAVAEGSTQVRVGSVLFGARPPHR